MKEYKFIHSYDGLYSKLDEIEECGEGGAKFNSTKMTYGNGNAKPFKKDLFLLSPNREGYLPRYADFNGDGMTDFISYPIKSSYCI
ncbi:hypothetical protein AwDysgo_21730 [Bacteroidales bacterium]|nr:hypothetical protein AwDysgo_21730 [Bacteroidales bacterium]